MRLTREESGLVLIVKESLVGTRRVKFLQGGYMSRHVHEKGINTSVTTSKQITDTGSVVVSGTLLFLIKTSSDICFVNTGPECIMSYT